jgi:hypothetical protein
MLFDRYETVCCARITSNVRAKRLFYVPAIIAVRIEHLLDEERVYV